MIYIDDCLRSLIEVMETPEENLRLRTYNVNAMSFTPQELHEAIKKYIPNFTITYKPDERQNIGKLFCVVFQVYLRTFLADTWPQSFDDSNARRDWGWNHEYDLDKLCQKMLVLLTAKYGYNSLDPRFADDLRASNGVPSAFENDKQHYIKYKSHISN